MKIPRDPIARLLLAAGMIILLGAVLPGFIGNFPLVKLLITLLVAWLAWQMAGKESGHTAFFSSERRHVSDMAGEKKGALRYVFSSAALDLTDSGALPERLNIQAAFSSVSVRLPVDASIAIHASGAFCSISMPGGESVVLGEQTVHCGSQDPSAPRLAIELSCAFGSVAMRMG